MSARPSSVAQPPFAVSAVLGANGITMPDVIAALWMSVNFYKLVEDTSNEFARELEDAGLGDLVPELLRDDVDLG